MAIILTPVGGPSVQQQEFIDNGMTPLLHQLQELEVFNEPGNIRSSTLVKFAYQNWRAAVTPEILRNRVEITSGFTIDNTNGTLSFTTPFDSAAAEEVRCTYGFRYYSNDQLADFLQLGLNTINNQRPTSAFTFVTNTVPVEWTTAVVELGVAHALETLLLDLLTWKAYLIFRDPTATASYVQGILSRIWSSWMQERRELKGRRFLKPRALASGRWRFPRSTTGFNFQQFTVIRN